MRPSSLDTVRPFTGRAHSPQTPAMPRPAVQLGVLNRQLPRENAAVVQGCVPFVVRISEWWMSRSIIAVAAMSSPKISLLPVIKRADQLLSRSEERDDPWEARWWAVRGDVNAGVAPAS